MNGPARVLLVADDEADMRLLVELYLAPAGCRVDTAADGAEALQRLELPPDVELLILDLRMPEVDGFDVLRRLRASEQYGDLPIVVISAHADDDVVDEVFDSGASAFLRKPFSREELLAEIQPLLPRR